MLLASNVMKTIRLAGVGKKTKYLSLALAALKGLFLPVNLAFAQTWTQADAPSMDWQALASSADGTKLLTVASFGPIHTSTNSGATWTTTTNAPYTPYLVSGACSAEGTILAATAYDWVHNQGGVYVSTNSGATWTSLFGFPALAVAVSADGSKLVVAGVGSYMGPGIISVSTDSGVTWVPASAPITNWSCVACSADGAKLFAGASRLSGPFWPSVAGPLYTSTDSGATWSPTAAPIDVWTSIASSADGVRLAAAGSGGIYTSTDSGGAWTSNSLPSLSWVSVASSADGRRLVAAAAVGVIYISTNSGRSWADTGAPGTNWSSVASSADGSRLVAVANRGGVWTSQSTPAPVLAITPSGNNTVVSWIVPSMDFRLQQNYDLTITNWTDLTNAPTLNLRSLRNEALLSATKGNYFYRLRH